DLYELAPNALPAPALSHLAVADALRDRRIPRAEEISAEADDEPRTREIESRQLVAAEAERVCPAHDLVAEQLEPDGRVAAEAREDLGDELQSAAAPWLRDEQQSLLLPRRRQPVELVDELSNRFVPRDVLERIGTARAVPLQRPRQPIRMVGHLNGRLASWA